MSRILIVNPNSDAACTSGISAAVEPFRAPGRPRLDVISSEAGPRGIYTWRDWHSAVEPLCRIVEREEADVYVLACASDPGLEAVREATRKPVLGIFRCAVAAALTRAERFGVIALVEPSKARHMAALRAMGTDSRLAAEIAMGVTIPDLLDPVRLRGRLIETARALSQAGAGCIILGCTGMAAHRAAIEAELGMPVVDPCQAGAAMALSVLA